MLGLSIFNSISGAVFGAALGSFLCCAVWRWSSKTSLLGRSYCPVCEQQLKDSWNIPIISWVALRGSSGCCQTPIPFRYLGYELVGAAGGAIGGWFLGWMAVAGIVLLVVGITALLSAWHRH